MIAGNPSLTSNSDEVDDSAGSIQKYDDNSEKIVTEDEILTEKTNSSIKLAGYKRKISRFTLHGFTDFYESHHSSTKFMWLSVLCCASVVLAIEIYFTITK